MAKLLPFHTYFYMLNECEFLLAVSTITALMNNFKILLYVANEWFCIYGKHKTV